MSEKMAPIHPGEIIRELFLIPGGISAYRLAKGTGLSQTRIGQILQGKRSITAETALRFAPFFGNSPQFWLNIQSHYDLDVAGEKFKARIDSEVTPLLAAG
jgi:addiction module HigA family antidote